MRTGHLSVKQGKRVKVFLRDADHFIAKFKEKTNRTITFYDHEPVSTVSVRTLTIFKEQQTNKIEGE